VTLKLNNADAETAFADLFAQAKLSMRGIERQTFERSADRRLTVDLVDRPFLEALLELCRQTAIEPHVGTMTEHGIGLSPRITRVGDTTFRLAPSPFDPPGAAATTGTTTPPPRPLPPIAFRGLPATTRATQPSTRPSWVDLPAVTVGPFVFIPREVSRRNWVNLGGDHGAFTSLAIITMLDPGVRLHAASTTLEVVEAVDEHGRSLLPEGREGREGRSPVEVQTRWDSGNWNWLSTLRLRYPPNDSRTIARLVVRLHGSVVTRSERIDLADLTRESTPALGSLCVKVEPVSGDETKGFTLPLTVFRDNLDDDAWKEIKTLMLDERAMRVTDEREQRIHVSGGRSTDTPLSRRVELRVSPTSQPSGKRAATRPARMVWTVPVEVEDVKVPVEFRNLPLP
jgi:hypothetical protein